MSNKTRYYDSNANYLTDKNLSIDLHMKMMLSKTIGMFEYNNLTEKIHSSQLEKLLQTNGYCIIANVNNNLYALNGTLGGELNEYDEPTKCVVANTYLNLSKEFTINKDCVLIKNDFYKLGLLPIFKKYGALITENFISMRVLMIMMRSIINFSASDERTKQGAEEYLNRLVNGDLGIIAESAFFDGVKLHTSGSNNNYLNQFIELMQYFKSCELQEIGVNSNYNLKREYIGKSENSLNDDILRPFVDNMLLCRQKGFEKVNEMFGTNISVDFGSIWKTVQLEDAKEKSNNLSEMVENNDESSNTQKIIDNTITDEIENTNMKLVSKEENTEEKEQSDNNEEKTETDKESKEIKTDNNSVKEKQMKIKEKQKRKEVNNGAFE